ncbi:unnamed protein product, partial [Mesorhabditis belari]|uniref:Uncharacterized protein n=1 Tax=Mesorhabditis belari TaxID=2138241 RepID=A0AAF3J499_9BILA
MLALLFLFIFLYLSFLFIRSRLEAETVTGLWNRAVFVTGCDCGFGHDIAIRLAKMGMPVFAGCLTQEGQKRLETEISNIPGAKLRAIECDVTNDESVEKMGKIVDTECQQYGGLWAVINNAGVGHGVFLDDFLQPDDYRLTMEVNLYGMIRVVHRLRRLVKQKKGRIVNVTSILGRCPVTCIGPYIISKHAANAYTEVIRKELSIFGVDVVNIEPGFVKTTLTNVDRIKKGNEHLWNRACTELKDEYGYEFFQKACENQAMMINSLGAEKTDNVMDAYTKAVTSAYPRRRYKVGWDTLFLWHPLTFLPTNVQDAIFCLLDRAAGAPTPARIQMEKSKL